MLTVADCLKLPELASANLIAGSPGLNRPVRLAHVVEEPDIASWSAPDVVILTTWHYQSADPDSWGALISALVERRVSALFVAVGRYISFIPESITQVADDLHFPVIALPWELPFITVTEAIYRALVEDNRETWTRISGLQIQATEAAVRANSLDQLLETFSKLLARSVWLSEDDEAGDGASQRFSLGSPDLHHWHLCVNPPLFGAPEQVLARQMAGLVAVSMLQQKLARQTETEVQGAILDRLLQGEWNVEGTWSQRLRVLGFHPDRSHLILLITIPHAFMENPGMLDSARDMLRRLNIGDHITSITAQGLVVLLRVSPVRGLQLKDTLGPFFTRFFGSAALVSGPVMLGDLSEAFRVMGKMAPLLEPGKLYTLGEALFPALVAELPEELMTTFVDTTWGRIKDPILFETLQAYVNAHGRRLEAAAALGVHRNTVTNRIEQIESVLGHPLDSTVITQLDLAYRWMLTRPKPIAAFLAGAMADESRDKAIHRRK